MANYNRYRGSYYPNYGNREEDRDRYSRKDYNQYESDYGNTEDYGRRDYSNRNQDMNTGSYGSRNEGNRRWRRYDEDYDDYRRRMSNYGNRSQRGYDMNDESIPFESDYDQNRYNRNRGRSEYGNTGNYGYSGEYNRNRNRNREEDYNYNEDYGTGSYGYGRNYNRNRDIQGAMNRDQDRGWWNKTKDEVSSWFGDEDAERRRRTDSNMGQHRGHGPKGYSRSDERIREDVNDRLSDDSFLDASEIEVQVNGGEVVMNGTVDTRIDKRRAEDLAEDISGVKNVQNQLRVKQTTATQASGLKTEYQG